MLCGIVRPMIKRELENIIKKALKTLSLNVKDVVLEHPTNTARGDYATNVPLIYAGKVNKKPIDFAGEIKAEIEKGESKIIEKIEIAGPGFINFFISKEAIEKEMNDIKKLEKGFDFNKKEKINIEFISANPTGALHIGHGRGAFYGDVLANVLEYTGAEVAREYYINNSRESVQIKELGKTALGKGKQYKTKEVGEMISKMDISGLYESEAGFMLGEMIQNKNQDFITGKLGIKFDEWFSEDEKIRAKKIADKLLDELKKKGLIYNMDGAVWIKTSEYGDDEDRVVVRSDGSNSYFIADIAYHEDKFKRGYDKIINVWGADHHGHVKRMHAVGKMLGWPQEPEPQPIIFITQLVSLKKDGEVKKMSKRAGTVVYLEEIVDNFGIDVVRWFFAEKSLGTHMEFDEELARQQSEKNPVYYVQYAHARISSIVEKAKEVKSDKSSLSGILREKSARALAMELAHFTDVVEDISKDFQIHKLTTYVYNLSRSFSHFYHEVRIINGDTYNSGALELVELVQKTIKQALDLLGIGAPEKM